MRIELQDYTIGHSSVCGDDIIIGDMCGRYVPVAIESLPEVISMMQMLISVEDSDVNPDEFTGGFHQEFMAKYDEPEDSATYLKDLMFLDANRLGAVLRWKHNGIIVNELDEEVYSQILRELESEA